MTLHSMEFTRRRRTQPVFTIWSHPRAYARASLARAVAGRGSRLEDATNFSNNSFMKIGIRGTFTRSSEKKARLAGAWRQGDGRGEKFLFGIGCNPLISPDSDE